MKLTQGQLIEILNRPGPHWLVAADLSQLNLAGANLQDANLIGANFTEAILVECRMVKVEMDYDTNFEKANMAKSILAGANIHGTSFSQVNLTGANFYLANIGYFANFSGANLRGSDFTKTNIMGVSFKNADLRDAKLDFASTMYEFYTSDTFWGMSGALFDGAIMMDGNEYIPSDERYCECPKCKSEIYPGALGCSDCNSTLSRDLNIPVLDKRKKLQ